MGCMFETYSDAVGMTDDDHYSLYSSTAPLQYQMS